MFKKTSQKYTIIAYYLPTEQSYGKFVNVGEKYQIHINDIMIYQLLLA